MVCGSGFEHLTLTNKYLNISHSYIIARAEISHLELELRRVYGQRDEFESSWHQATQELHQLRTELYDIATKLFQTAASAPPGLSSISPEEQTPNSGLKREHTSSPSPSAVSYYERPKIQVGTDMWMAADEESQLLVSPPRQHQKRARTSSGGYLWS